MTHPYDFAAAIEAARKASEAQRTVEQQLRTAHHALAEAERLYRRALSQRLVELHANGVAWTACSDLARGNDRVSQLRYERDLAHGNVAVATQAAFRAGADRRDASDFVDWSKRAAFRDDHGQPTGREPTYGLRSAA